MKNKVQHSLNIVKHKGPNHLFQIAIERVNTRLVFQITFDDSQVLGTFSSERILNIRLVYPTCNQYSTES